MGFDGEEKLVAEIHRLLDEQAAALHGRLDLVEPLEYTGRWKRIEALLAELAKR